MVSEKVIVNNETGLHARPASEIVKIASKYKSEINILVNKKIINAKSPLMIMSAGIKNNSVLEIQCNGEDEEEAIKEIIKGFETNFGE